MEQWKQDKFKEFSKVIQNIEYLDWELNINLDHTGDLYLQWLFDGIDVDTGQKEWQRCRKWKLSYHMMPQEIERTAYLALRQAVLHEMDENYKYRGVAIRNPHIDPDAMVEIAQRTVSRPIYRRDEHHEKTTA